MLDFLGAKIKKEMGSLASSGPQSLIDGIDVGTTTAGNGRNERGSGVGIRHEGFSCKASRSVGHAAVRSFWFLDI
jgi:hypothetical protein